MVPPDVWRRAAGLVPVTAARRAVGSPSWPGKASQPEAGVHGRVRPALRRAQPWSCGGARRTGRAHGHQDDEGGPLPHRELCRNHSHRSGPRSAWSGTDARPAPRWGAPIGKDAPMAGDGGADRQGPPAAPAADGTVRFASAQGRWVLLATILGSAVAGLDATAVNVALR